MVELRRTRTSDKTRQKRIRVLIFFFSTVSFIGRSKRRFIFAWLALSGDTLT
jgi:hypothetical protein